MTLPGGMIVRGGDARTLPELVRAGAAAGTLLGPERLVRWRRSAWWFSAGMSADKQVAFAGRIEVHPQFAGMKAVGESPASARPR